MPTISLTDYVPHAKQKAFHADPSKVRLLLGAWRAGKSWALLWEAIYMALRVAERAGAGASFALFRKTGPALHDTLVRDFDQMIPHALVKSRLSTPGRVERVIQGGTRLMFRCMDDWRKQGGQSFDGIFLDEAWEFEAIDFDMLLGRLSGKYGPRRMVVATNPPTRNHWLYDRFVKRPKPGYALHTFTTYDNLANLAPDYITELEQMDEARKRRFIYGEWGFTSDNQPVFPEFREATHIADLKFHPYPGAFLLAGWDFGFRMPAVVIAQVLPTGHVNILREVIGQNIDVRVFAKQVQQVLETYWPTVPVIHYCDAAGIQKNDLATSSIEELRKEGITPRFRKMRVMKTIDQLRELIRTLHLGVPLLRVNRTDCQMTIEAFCGGYGMDPKTDEPSKDGVYDHCVTGDTKVRTLAGWERIDALVGQEFWTYAYDGRRLVPARAHAVRRTRQHAEVWALTLDDQSVLRATPEHLVMRRDGTFAELRTLVPGDRLMPFYEAVNARGYVSINLADGSFAYEHRYVFAWFNGVLLPEHHVHHRDGRRQNNAPDNLEQQDAKVHMADHYARMTTSRHRTNGSTNPWRPETRAKVSLWARAYWRTRRHPAICPGCGAGFLRLEKNGRGSQQWCSTSCRERARGRIRRQAMREQRRLTAANHRVVSVAPAGYADVFNLEVEGHHNFPAGSVMVHNCMDATRYAIVPAVFIPGGGLQPIAAARRNARVAI